MRFVRSKLEDGAKLLLEHEKQLVSVSNLLEVRNKTIDLSDIFDKIDEIRIGLKRGNYSVEPSGEISYAPSVGNPGKILCVGLNYVAHIEETKKEVPKYPVLFSKFGNSLAGNKEDIPIPLDNLKVDYEGELGVIMGKKAYKVSEAMALEYVFGYYVGNDVSSRELQYRTSQYLLGKSLDKFYPNGPTVVTRDEIPDPQALNIKTYVNGEIRQNSNTSKMIFPVSKLISYISSFMTLNPGDVISTGTPDMVIMGMPEEKRKWLKNGDIVKVSIENIGTLENKFVEVEKTIIT